MLCEQCKKRTATVFYNEKLNGRSRSLSLCGECASKLRESGEIRDVTSMIGSFADPFSALQDERFGDFFGLRILRAKEEKILCPCCGRALAAILADGKVGCAECYSCFSEELSPLLRSLHGGAAHRGRIPSRLLARRARIEQLSRLREELQKAIREEKFEEAARLRDEIRILEEQKEGNGNGLV
jgi:protein arginine kinase activator